MRYLLLTFIIGCLAVVGIAGKRGTLSRNTPLYMFPDMRRQLKLRPQEPDGFFANGTSSQLPVPGTIARGKTIQSVNGPVYSYEDSPVFSGHIVGSTNFIENNPLPITAQLIRRGQQRFTIYCSPCHGQEGDGSGITRKIGAMAVVANLHDKRIVEMTDGEIFHVITNGRNLMGAYGPNVPVEDRWAIVAYVRALQLSWLGSADDLSPDKRGALK